jgi:hypothetical protein
MFRTERLKVTRALPATPDRPPRKLRLIMSNDQDADLRDTLPPSSETEPPPGFDPLPSDTLKKLEGYDESKFLHAALAAAADAAHESREYRKAHDPEALIAAARVEFEKAVTAGYEMIRQPMADTLAEVRALTPRVKGLEEVTQALKSELATMKETHARDIKRLEDEIARIARLASGQQQ